MSIFNELLPKILEIYKPSVESFNETYKAAIESFAKFEEDHKNGCSGGRRDNASRKEKVGMTTLQSINEDDVGVAETNTLQQSNTNQTTSNNDITKSSDDIDKSSAESTDSNKQRRSKKRSKHEVDGMSSPELDKRQKRSAAVKALTTISYQEREILKDLNENGVALVSSTDGVNLNLNEKLRREEPSGPTTKPGRGRPRLTQDKENMLPVSPIKIKQEKISLPTEPMDMESLPLSDNLIRGVVKDEIAMPPPVAPVPKTRKAARKEKSVESSDENTEPTSRRQRSTRTRDTTDSMPPPPVPSTRSTRASSRASSRAAKQAESDTSKSADTEDPPPPETRPKRTRTKKKISSSASIENETVSTTPEKPRPKRTRRGQKAAEKDEKSEESVNSEPEKIDQPVQPEIISLKVERISQPTPQSPLLLNNSKKLYNRNSGEHNKKLQKQKSDEQTKEYNSDVENKRSQKQNSDVEKKKLQKQNSEEEKRKLQKENSDVNKEVQKQNSKEDRKRIQKQNSEEENKNQISKEENKKLQKQTSVEENEKLQKQNSEIKNKNLPKQNSDEHKTDKTKTKSKKLDRRHSDEDLDGLTKNNIALNETQVIANDNVNSTVTLTTEMDKTMILPNGLYNHAPVTPQNICHMDKTVVLEPRNRETMVLEKAQHGFMNATVVLERDPKVTSSSQLTDDNSILTDDNSGTERETPEKRPPLVQQSSAVKEKVQQFEELAARTTRTKTRAMAKMENQDNHTPPDKTIKPVLSAETLAKMNNMIFNGKPPQISASATKPRAIPVPVKPVTASTSKLNALNKHREAANETLQKEKEDARKKKEAMLEAKREQQRKKREEKMAAAAAVREAAERQRRLDMEMAVKGRMEKQAHADLGKLERLKEVERKKLELARKAAETEERRKAEEQARQQRLEEEQKKAEAARKKHLEEAEAMKKEAAIHKEIEKRQKEYLEKQKLKHRLENDKMTTPLRTNGAEPVYMADGFQYLHSDEEDDTVRRPVPVWCMSKARRHALCVQSNLNPTLMDRLFMVRVHSPDLREIFPTLERRIKRTSSAVWRTPPRPHPLPALAE